MKIAIQAADLDHSRIDGTRVYLLNVLRHLGNLSPGDEFLIYHRGKFNPELDPPKLSNYTEREVSSPILWTQTRFSWEIWKEKPDVLWMPMHNIPFLRKKKTKAVVTIHDLAFKFFPDHFTKKDQVKLNFLANLAIKKADKLIAVSQSTKRDIMRFYPSVPEEKIKVIYHGFDKQLFEGENDKSDVLNQFSLRDSRYLLYVGALQPRKNLETLIAAFDVYKKQNSEMKLVLAGGRAWLWEEIEKKVNASLHKKDIILTGRVNFNDLATLYKNAALFVFPSLYEGFGIPILEAFASGVPVIAADNSSLPEVGGEAAQYFNANDKKDLAEKIKLVLESKELQKSMTEKGRQQAKKFSWKKCAQETLNYIKE